MTTIKLQERFQTLVDEHKKILSKVCKSYCRSRDDRDYLAQEIVIQLWRSFGVFDERYRFSTWMYRIALNVAISFYRRERTRTRHVVSDEDHLLNAADDAESQPEDIRLLYRFIEGLDPLNKALVLLYLDGNSYREMADVLGISETGLECAERARLAPTPRIPCWRARVLKGQCSRSRRGRGQTRRARARFPQRQRASSGNSAKGAPFKNQGKGAVLEEAEGHVKKTFLSVLIRGPATLQDFRL